LKLEKSIFSSSQEAQMSTGRVSANVNEFWYERSGTVERRFYGVFEGGGAKGVAYGGALESMAKNRCWFRAVAGASAGAITATLVAAGLSPREIQDRTDSALQNVRTGVWAGLRRLQTETGYFPSDGLRRWLDEILRQQVAVKSDISINSRVTFKELYAATGIELLVVAADLSLRCQVIFSCFHTEECAVADAVVASASIPFAFPSCLIQVPDPQTKQLYHHTIVDGGVWSNFPMFVFEDRAFRAYYKLAPKEIPAEQILGLLLKEQAADRGVQIGSKVAFVHEVPPNHFRALEWDEGSQTAAGESNGIAAKIGICLLYPFSLLGRFLEWNGGVEPGRWPTPRSTVALHLVRSINGLAAGIYPWLLGILACAIVVIGAWTVIGSVVADQSRAFSATNWRDPMTYVARPLTILLTVIAVAVSILSVFASIVAVSANRLLLRVNRRLLYSLVHTYVAGPGAPEWTAAKENIIQLPIPPKITTLSFDMSPTEREELLRLAREAADARLSQILAERGKGQFA
jgi:patatin-like phospholipase